MPQEGDRKPCSFYECKGQMVFSERLRVDTARAVGYGQKLPEPRHEPGWRCEMEHDHVDLLKR